MSYKEALEILRSLPEPWGASEAEVREVESHLGVRLPPPLRELMLRTGGVMHMQWLSPDGEFPPLAKLPLLKEIATEILEEDAPHLRPTFPFVALSQHDGCYFTFVRVDGQDPDPVVMGYQQFHGFNPDGTPIGQCIAAAVRRALLRA